MGEPVIVLCPCCASTIDTLASDEVQHFECGLCRQQWSMVVDGERHNRYSLT